MTDQLFQQMLPSTGILAVGIAVMLSVIGIVLVQISARVWMHHHRERKLRDHIARVEARWHEAAM